MFIAAKFKMNIAFSPIPKTKWNISKKLLKIEPYPWKIPRLKIYFFFKIRIGFIIKFFTLLQHSYYPLTVRPVVAFLVFHGCIWKHFGSQNHFVGTTIDLLVTYLPTVWTVQNTFKKQGHAKVERFAWHKRFFKCHAMYENERYAWHNTNASICDCTVRQSEDFGSTFS